MPSGKDRLIVERATQLHHPGSRRRFLRLLGLGGSVVLLPSVFAACDDDDDITGPGAVMLDLTTDVGILNYAYALEQLEAAFYTQVVAGFATSGITDTTERTLLTDIRDHEIAHREFLKAKLGNGAVGALEVDFGDALASRTSVLQTAMAFEDLGVAAYNGAGKYLESADFLTVAGKIVSVEARHAAVLHALTGSVYSFAGFLDDGLDEAMEPADVLDDADPYITTDVTIGAGPS